MTNAIRPDDLASLLANDEAQPLCRLAREAVSAEG